MSKPNLADDSGDALRIRLDRISTLVDHLANLMFERDASTQQLETAVSFLDQEIRDTHAEQHRLVTLALTELAEGAK